MEDSFSKTRIIQFSLILTAAIETITIFCRYGLGLRASSATASTLGKLFLGLRIHHGYLGLLFVFLAFWVGSRSAILKNILIVVGSALFLSDAIHHFLVLWPLEGSPQFDFFYTFGK